MPAPDEPGPPRWLRPALWAFVVAAPLLVAWLFGAYGGVRTIPSIP